MVTSGLTRSTDEDAQQVAHLRELDLPSSLEDKLKNNKKHNQHNQYMPEPWQFQPVR